jgi:hypothetical protein
VEGGRIPEATEISEEAQEQYKVTIPGASIGRDEEGVSVVWFRVTTVCTGPNGTRRTSVHRRFREFGELCDDMRASFKGNHLLGNVPDMPRKELKVLANHMDPVFIEERRVRLELFMVSWMTLLFMRGFHSYSPSCNIEGAYRASGPILYRSMPPLFHWHVGTGQLCHTILTSIHVLVILPLPPTAGSRNFIPVWQRSSW